MSHFVLFHWIMIQIFIVHTASETVVRGVIGQPVKLPCSYPVAREKDVSDMCWGKGPCPNSKCNNKILHTTGSRVTFRTSQRYSLQGYISYGDVSLTIQEVTEQDVGIYCCRIEIPGWFNDIKKHIRLAVFRPIPVKKKPTKKGPKTPKHFRKTTFAPQATSGVQATTRAAVVLTTTVPPAAPGTTESPTVTTMGAVAPPTFDVTASGTFPGRMVATNVLPDFSTDARTEAPPVKTTTTRETPTSTTDFRKTTLTPQATCDLQATTWAADHLTTTVPPAAPATTESPSTFGVATSGTFPEGVVTTSALPDFSTSFQAADVWTEGSTESIPFPEVTTEFPSTLLTVDRTEEANTSLLMEGVPTVETSSSSDISAEKVGVKLPFSISTILSISLIGMSVLLILMLLSLVWKRKHTRKVILKRLRPAEDLEKVFSGAEGENSLLVL